MNMPSRAHFYTAVSLSLFFTVVIVMAALPMVAGCAVDSVQHKDSPVDAKYVMLERDVFAETNRLRTSPRSYAAVLYDIANRIQDNIYYPVNSAIGVKMAEGSAAVTEAVTAISTVQPMSKLKWSDALAQAAREHVLDTGAKGLVGHESSGGKSLAERLKPIMLQEKYTSIAENIAYGLDVGRDVVAHLFIDDGVPGRGHRKNLTMKKLNYIGVACGYHKRYRHMCVAVYAYHPE